MLPGEVSVRHLVCIDMPTALVKGYRLIPPNVRNLWSSKRSSTSHLALASIAVFDLPKAAYYATPTPVTKALRSLGFPIPRMQGIEPGVAWGG